MSKNTTFVQWAQEMCHTNTVIEYLVYRRPGLYTPYEQDKKYMDETIYEDSHYTSAIIREVIDLGNGDYLIGMQNIIDSDYMEELPKFGDDDYCIDYVRLSEIRMSMRYGHQLLDNPTYPRQDEEMEE